MEILISSLLRNSDYDFLRLEIDCSKIVAECIQEGIENFKNIHFYGCDKQDEYRKMLHKFIAMDRDFAEIIYKALNKNKENFKNINYIKLCFVRKYFPQGESMLNQLNAEEAIKGYVNIVIEEELKPFQNLIRQFQNNFNKLLYK